MTSFFRDVPVFALLSPTELSALVRELDRFDRQPGERLFAQGDASDGMYVIERGEVGVFTQKRTGERVLLAELGNGAVIGELSLIDGEPRSALVETVAATTGYFLSRAKFDVMRRNWDLAAYKLVFALGRTLEERRRVTEQRVRALINEADAGDLGDRELKELFGSILKG